MYNSIYKNVEFHNIPTIHATDKINTFKNENTIKKFFCISKITISIFIYKINGAGIPLNPN
jgi:hypothetical protein